MLPARRSILIIILSIAGLLGTSPAGAVAFSDDAFFAANGRSIWSAGSGFSLDTGQRFLGTSWDVGKTVGGIKEVCVLFACADFGAEIGAKTSGKLGIDYSLKIDSGTFDIQVPGRATFTTPDSRTSKIVGDVTIGSSFTTLAGGLLVPTATNGPAVVRLPSLQVTGPTAQASLGLEAKVNAFAGAKACVVVCYGPALGPLGFDKSQSIATVNLGNNGKVTLLGDSVSANQSVSGFGGLLNASFNVPNLDSTSATTPGGYSNGTLTSFKRDKVAVVNANVAQIAADAVGFPIPLSGNLGPFGYNLLQANAGAAFDVQQSISVTPKVTGSYLFSSSVVPVVNGVAGAPTNEIDFNFGDDVTFRPGQVSKISYLPVVNLDGLVRNQTDIVIGGNVDVKALGVDIAGLSIGPLIDTRLASTDLGRISLFDDSFSERLGSVKTAPITLDFSSCGNPIKGAGDATPVTYGNCASSDYAAVGPIANPNGTSFYGVDADGCLASPPGSLGFCYSIPFVDETNSFVSGGLRRPPTYLASSDTFNYNLITTTASTTDANQVAALASLGYNGPPLGDPSTFGIPQGASFDAIVAEPPPLGIFLLAAIVTISLVYRNQRVVRSASPLQIGRKLVSAIAAG